MTQRPGKHDLKIYQYATYELTGTLKEDDEPTDLTGHTLRLDARTAHGAVSTIFSLTSEGGAGITLDAEAGTFTAFLTAEQTAGLTATAPHSGGYYDLILIAPGGEPVTRLMEGKVLIYPGITV